LTALLLRGGRRTFLSLRKHRNYRLFFTGQVVSVSGTWMQNIAAAWVILELTHSPVAVGVLALCQFLPFTLFGLFAGVLVDRFDARRTVIATQASAMALAGMLAALVVTGHVTATQVYVLTALRGIVLVLDAPARQALTFQMVGRDELPNAVALNSSLFNAARVVGPALGGLLVATVGAGACFQYLFGEMSGLSAVERVDDVVDEVQQLIDERARIDLFFFSEVDKVSVNSVTTRPPFIFIDKRTRVNDKVQILGPEFIDLRTDSLE